MRKKLLALAVASLAAMALGGCDLLAGLWTEAPVINFTYPAQTYWAGGSVTIDAGASYDPADKPLTFDWELASVPAGSTAATLTPVDPDSQAILATDLSGDYTVRLTVSNGTKSSTAELTIFFEIMPS